MDHEEFDARLRCRVTITAQSLSLDSMTALARRWYLHALYGGRLRPEDMTILVQWLEGQPRG